jgi:uncharacterized protein YjbI with pentapeptide repeats
MHHLRAERLFTNEEKRLLAGLFLKDTCFDHVDFRDADLSQAVFDRVSLIGCDFRGATLASAVFRHCDLRGTRFDRATSLHGSRFDGSCLLAAVGLSRWARQHVRRTGGTFFAAV